jgi:hypothetical protein
VARGVVVGEVVAPARVTAGVVTTAAEGKGGKPVSDWLVACERTTESVVVVDDDAVFAEALL